MFFVRNFRIKREMNESWERIFEIRREMSRLIDNNVPFTDERLVAYSSEISKLGEKLYSLKGQM